MFFEKDSFFRALRMILAYDSERVPVGNVVIDVIGSDKAFDTPNATYIPALKKEIEREPDEGKREELQELLEVWEKYGDPSTTEGQSWNQQAAAVITNVANKFRLGLAQQEELAQDVWGKFYSRGVDEDRGVGLGTPIRTLMKYNYHNGPTKLMSLFKKIAGQEAISVMRDKLGERTKGDERGFQDAPVSIEEDSIALHHMEDLKSREFNQNYVKKMKRNIIRFMKKELKDTDAEILFDIWVDLASKVGPEDVSGKDLYERWGEITGKSKSSQDRHWAVIKKLILKYLEEEEKKNPRPSVKRMLNKVKVSQSVAEAFIHRRFVAWMLKPYRKSVRRFNASIRLQVPRV